MHWLDCARILAPTRPAASSEVNTRIMAITTRSSIKVKAPCWGEWSGWRWNIGKWPGRILRTSLQARDEEKIGGDLDSVKHHFLQFVQFKEKA